MQHGEAARSLEQPARDDSGGDAHRRSFWLIGAAMVIVFVVYPLSYGPLMYQVSMGRLLGLWPVIDMVYAPIEWFANSSEFGEELVDWYLGVWGA